MQQRIEIGKRVMYVGGGWGDAIYFLNPDDEVKTRIYGFKHRWYNGFAEGSVLFDLAHNTYNDTIPLYLIKNIEYKDDPHDMFFADIELMGDVRNPKTDDYKPDWFMEPVKELIAEYEKLSWWQRRKKRHIIRTLKEMVEV